MPRSYILRQWTHATPMLVHYIVWGWVFFNVKGNEHMSAWTGTSTGPAIYSYCCEICNYDGTTFLMYRTQTSQEKIHWWIRTFVILLRIQRDSFYSIINELFNSFTAIRDWYLLLCELTHFNYKYYYKTALQIQENLMGQPVQQRGTGFQHSITYSYKLSTWNSHWFCISREKKIKCPLRYVCKYTLLEFPPQWLFLCFKFPVARRIKHYLFYFFKKEW